MVQHRVVFAFALVAGMAGCGSQTVWPIQSGLPGVLSSRATSASSSQYIQHVVILIQENRSYDDFFATFPGADGATYGCMRLPTSSSLRGNARRFSSSGCPSGDQRVPLKAGSLFTQDLDHDHFAFNKEFHGGLMDGFDRVRREVHRGDRVPAGTYAYRYVSPDNIKLYWDIAKQWVLADHMFTTQGSSSFTAHQDFIAGGTPIGRDDVIDFPYPPKWGCTAPSGTVTNLITPERHELYGKGPFPCFSYKTLRDLLDAAGVSWLYFTNPSGASLWNAFDAIKAVRKGKEWSTNIIVPETKVLDYVDAGTLPAVSWVIPDADTSDHPSSPEDKGPEWVSSVINAIGESSYWPSTLIVVVWDEWGGEYDHVPPPQLDGQGLGPRVPMLIVSAYDKTSAKRPGYVSHTQYEDGSVLKFIEDNWNLGSLGTSDVRAKSIIDCFDFNKQPRAFVPIPTDYTKSYWEHYKPSSDPIDEY